MAWQQGNLINLKKKNLNEIGRVKRGKMVGPAIFSTPFRSFHWNCIHLQMNKLVCILHTYICCASIAFSAWKNPQIHSNSKFT